MKCFLLAAGDGVRFQGGYPKQHIEVGGERLIDRTLRLFASVGPVVVSRVELAAAVRFFPRFSTCTAATVLSTKRMWGGRNLFLYSDVFYTDGAAAAILGDRQNGPLFWTDGADIFAFKLPGGEPKLIRMLERIAGRRERPDGNCGRMWELYRALFGIEKWPIAPTDGKPGLAFIADRTQDFDTVQDLEMFRAGISKNVLFGR